MRRGRPRPARACAPGRCRCAGQARRRRAAPPAQSGTAARLPRRRSRARHESDDHREQARVVPTPVRLREAGAAGRRPPAPAAARRVRPPRRRLPARRGSGSGPSRRSAVPRPARCPPPARARRPPGRRPAGSVPGAGGPDRAAAPRASRSSGPGPCRAGAAPRRRWTPRRPSAQASTTSRSCASESESPGSTGATRTPHGMPMAVSRRMASTRRSGGGVPGLGQRPHGAVERADGEAHRHLGALARPRRAAAASRRMSVDLVRMLNGLRAPESVSTMPRVRWYLPSACW